MSDPKTRLDQVKANLTSHKTTMSVPFDPNATSFPNRKDVPTREGAPPGAAWVWGEDDQVN